MKTESIRPFIPSKDYEKSREFYSALGFHIEDAGPELAICSLASCTFFLPKIYHKGLGDKLMLQLVVKDINDALRTIEEVQNNSLEYSPIQDEPWGQVIYLTGPSGELWHITELKQ